MSDLMAESLPLPTPLTIIETVSGPVFFTFSEIAATTFDEANGVAFLGPENPREPADPHAKTLPELSVIVITVLLYEALIYTFPSATFLDFFAPEADRATADSTPALSLSASSDDCVVIFFLPIVLILTLLQINFSLSATGCFPYISANRARICSCPLSARRQSPRMPYPTICL